MRPGVEVVAEAAGLDDAVRGADLVLTGEGSLDRQTLAGKTPAGVAAVATRHGVPVIAFAGRLGDGADELVEEGFVAVQSITRGPGTLADALREGTREPRTGGRHGAAHSRPRLAAGRACRGPSLVELVETVREPLTATSASMSSTSGGSSPSPTTTSTSESRMRRAPGGS